MGATQTVPMFAPDGTLGDIPYERMKAAQAAGFTPGVTMKSADGKFGVIPSNRMAEATKGGLQIVPLHEQETQHPGFWANLGEDLKGMAKGVLDPKNVLLNAATMGLGSSVKAIAEVPAQVEHAKEQEAAGYSLPYRVLTPVAETLGVNVRGMEDSAKEGDTAGVAGHAAALPTVMAATAGVAKAAPVISDVASAAARKASQAAESAARITPKQAAQTVGAGTGAGLGHGALSLPGAYYGAKTFGNIAEAVLGKGRANTPIFARAPELSLDNITDALAQTIADDRARFTEMQAKGLGEIPATGAKPAAQTGEALATQPVGKEPTPPKGGGMPRFNASDRAAAQSLLQDALKHGTNDVIDAAVPKDNHGANIHTKAQVEFYLNRGDIAGAENALDTAAKQANPSWQPPQRQIVPSTNEIRARVQGEAKAAANADQLDTRALQQEMAADLQRHGWAAESEARREFIARNSNEFNKSGKSRGYVEGEQVTLTRTKSASGSGTVRREAAPASDDLTDQLQKSLDEVRKKQQGK